MDVHLLDESQAIATVGPVVVRVIVTAPTEVSHLDRLAEHVERVLQRSPTAGLWIVAHHGAPLPESQARRYAGRVFQPFDERLAVGFALLGLGFWSGAAIAVTITLTKIMRMRSPIETTVERSAEKLCMDLIGVDPTRLVAAHDDLLAQIKYHSPACP